MNIQIQDIAHHRNGIAGEPFDVVRFTADLGDGDQRFVATVFGSENRNTARVAVLDVDRLADDDIAFGSNSWRGDQFARPLVDAIIRNEERGLVDALPVEFCPGDVLRDVTDLDDDELVEVLQAPRGRTDGMMLVEYESGERLVVDPEGYVLDHRPTAHPRAGVRS